MWIKKITRPLVSSYAWDEATDSYEWMAKRVTVRKEVWVDPSNEEMESPVEYATWMTPYFLIVGSLFIWAFGAFISYYSLQFVLLPLILAAAFRTAWVASQEDQA